MTEELHFEEAQTIHQSTATCQQHDQDMHMLLLKSLQLRASTFPHFYSNLNVIQEEKEEEEGKEEGEEEGVKDISKNDR